MGAQKWWEWKFGRGLKLGIQLASNKENHSSQWIKEVLCLGTHNKVLWLEDKDFIKTTIISPFIRLLRAEELRGTKEGLKVANNVFREMLVVVLVEVEKLITTEQRGKNNQSVL